MTLGKRWTTGGLDTTIGRVLGKRPKDALKKSSHPPAPAQASGRKRAILEKKTGRGGGNVTRVAGAGKALRTGALSIFNIM